MRMVTAQIPDMDLSPADWFTRQAEEDDMTGRTDRRTLERIALEDSTLIGGVIAEEIEESLQRGWAFDGIAAAVCQAYACRKHSPQLLENEPLPYE